ncbi:hypothetical protein [Paraglaciecola mesophila]|nr:hypothetical protein [Paraglaciecola mesophila]
MGAEKLLIYKRYQVDRPEMLKKEKVILHIGLHKTGTTSIQQFLAENRNQLGDLDYVCYTQEGYFREDGNAYFLLKQKNWYSSKRSYQLDIPLLLTNIRKSQKKRVMISSEALSWCVNLADIEELKAQLLEVAHEVLVLAYVREPVSFAISIYTEGLKYPNSLSVLTDYNHPCLSSAHLRKQFLFEHYTFGNILPWKDVFLNDFTVKSLEKEKLLAGNLLVEILKILELGNCEELHKKALNYRRENEGFNLLQVHYLTSLYRFLNKFKDSHRLKSLAYELIKRKLHWLESDKKFNVENDVAIKYFTEIRDGLLMSKAHLGESVDTEFKYKKRSVDSLSFLDYVKILIVAITHSFFFGVYILTRIFKSIIG